MLIFKKARVLFLIALFFANYAFAEEVISIKADFTQKEVLAIFTDDEKTEDHITFENIVTKLFSQAPYLIAQADSDLNLKLSLDDTQNEKFMPNFETMHSKEYGYIMYYNIVNVPEGRKISYIVYDATYQEIVSKNIYIFAKNNLQKAIYNIANEVFFKVTTEFPFFIGKLMYTERSDVTGKQILFSQNIDRKKIKYTNENLLLTSPSYCNGGKKIFIAAQESNQLMNIQEINLSTLTKSIIKLPQSLRETNLSSPDVSQDCKNLLFTSLNGSNFGIYLYSNGVTKTVLKNSYINTRPSFSPHFEYDGKIYYISNKYGSPKIFEKSTFTGEDNVISRGLGAYMYYSISPDGKKIAFTKIFSKYFYTGVMNIDGSNEILFKKGYIIEAPSWAPYGRNFIVSIQESKNSTRKIYSISSGTGHSYPLWVKPADIVQTNWIISPEDTLPSYYNTL